MKDFKDFVIDNNIEPELDESVLSEAMWGFMSSLDAAVIESLDSDQLAEYIEIVEYVAGEEEFLYEAKEKIPKNERELVADALDMDFADKAAEVIKKGTLTFKNSEKEDLSDAFADYADRHGLPSRDDDIIREWESFFSEAVMEEFDKTIAAKSVLKSKMHKDVFTLPEHAAKPLLKKGLIEINKSTRNVPGKDKAYSITDKGKNFVEESTDLEEIMPAKKVRRDVIKKRKASREHRKVKAKRKIEGKRKRKTATFKRFKKKAKRLGKRGLTSTGKRKRTFINKG
jgi:DNA-binding PadR family transcriptional regulator